MSETMLVPPPDQSAEKRTPTVYFIDDSATMREVIKIAFRNENMNVVTCGDASTAFVQFEQTRPDVVITDVIMPDQDGYSLCSQIKESAHLQGIPVILMSGVVNKTVADKAVSVKADDLIRKPFQPQELIGRVKKLLGTNEPEPEHHVERPATTNALNSFFTPLPLPASPRVPARVPHPQIAPQTAWPRALADAFGPRPQTTQPPHVHQPAVPPSPQVPQTQQALPQVRPATSADIQKLRAEIAHLDLLIKKLQTELQIERQYNQALESQIRTLTNLE
jgi:twitching motility two-component system response regulator PilH